MASNTTIQIRRSLSTGIPPSLVIGELGYSYSSNTLFIGNTTGTGVINIGGYSYVSRLDAASSSNGAGTLVQRSANGSIQVNDLSALGNIYGTFQGTLTNTGVTAGWYGNNVVIPVIQVGSDGRLISASNVDIGAALVAGNAFIRFITQSAGQNVVADLVEDDVTLVGANGIIVTSNALFDSINVSLTESGVTSATYGDSLSGDTFNLPSFTVDKYGRITAASDTSVDLSAILDPLFANLAFKTFATQSSGQDVVADKVDDTVSFQGANGIAVTSNSLTDTINVALTATGVTAATYGEGDLTDWAIKVPVIDVDAYGRITSASNVTANLATTLDSRYVKLTSATLQTINSDLTVNGNLTIRGNTSIQNVSTFSVSDPLFYLASNNYTSDIVDIGFVANYNNGSCTSTHTGLVRDSNATKDWYLFTEYNQEPDEANNQMDFSGTVPYQIANLRANLITSGIIYQGTQLSTWFNNVGTGANNYTTNAIATASLNVSNVTAGTLAVQYGGTGATSHLLNSVLLGNGTDPIKNVFSSTEGHVLKISSANVPEFGMLDGGGF